jgi:hypothetical protein
VSALLLSENNFFLVKDLAFDWLKPKVVMTNSETVRISVLEERRKKLRSVTGLQQRRLSNLLMALNRGDLSFSSAYHGSLFALTAFTLAIPPTPTSCHTTPPHSPVANRLATLPLVAVVTLAAAVGGVFVLQFNHLVTFYSVVGSVYYFSYQAALAGP